MHATGGGIHPVMALSDYMPYGAPELLEGASPRMARATFASTALVASLVWCLGIVVANHPGTGVPPVVELPPDIFRPEQIRVHEPTRAVPPVVPSTPSKDAEFRPVLDDTPQPPAIDPSTPVGPEPQAPAGRIGESDALPVGSGIAPCACGVDPLPNEYVYTDELPTLVRARKPVYPDIAREAGVEGTVKLQLLVGLDGHVERAIVRPGGSVPLLDDVAIAAALASVFTPALVNNHPIKVWVAQEYRFTLH